MTEKPCAVFDLDGTLAETAPDLIGAANELLAGHGVPEMPVSVARETAGFGAKALIRKSLTLAGRDSDEAVIDSLFQPFLEVYALRVARESHLFEGVEDTLQTLSADGWALAVCTNKPESLAVSLLDALGVGEHFAALIGADTLPVRKPDPAPLTEALRRAGGDVRTTIMIGDTETDLLTARAAGVPCILTTFGYSPVPVADLAPDWTVDSFGEIADILRARHPAAASA